MARTTIDDVAARAGVSIKTVSRVLNDEPGVRAETRTRVRAVMAELNYNPSLHARSLAGRRSNLLGLVYDNPSPSYVFAVQNGAMAKSRDANFRLLVLSCQNLRERTVEEVLALAEQTHVDGLVLTPPLSANHELIAVLDRRSVPFVRIAPDALEHESPTVTMDDQGAAREMTEHLIARGHRSIAFIAGHPDHPSSRMRLRGFRDAVESHGLAEDDCRVEPGFGTVHSGIEVARRLLHRPRRPTAIFASNSDMAAGVAVVALEMGLHVPSQLSVAAVDDTDLGEMFWPPLTTIHLSSYDMAYTATDLLIRLVRGEGVPRVTRMDHRLVIRGSSGPAARREHRDVIAVQMGQD